MPATHRRAGSGKFLGLANRAFDVHLCEIFLGWRLGLSAVTAPREVLLDDLRLALIELKVTHACFVPSLLDQAGFKPGDVPDLVYFSVGGEKISRQILTAWGNQEKTLVVNAYGPTEVAIGCCASMLTHNSNARNIGRPFGNTTAHVLILGTNDYAIRGQSGELCVTGDLVGNGYLDRPDVLGFLEDFGGQRMYRTGDIVRMMADGSLEYLGRGDDQTKIRGQRIELAEVSESIRNASSRAADVATLLLQHPELSRTQLISFVSHASDRSRRYNAQPILETHLQDWTQELLSVCKDRLPAYMVPNHVPPVSIIPLAQISGKADAKILKAFFSSLSLSKLFSVSKKSDADVLAPRTMNKDEELVRQAMEKVIKIERGNLSFRSNIFELGFDSLSAINLSSQLRKSGFDSSLTAVFSRPTVEELAALPKLASQIKQGENLRDDRSSKLGSFEVQIRQKLVSDLGTVERIRPCLPLQEGLIARSLNQDVKGLYVNHIVLKLQTTIDIRRLKQAWRAVTTDHPILRTCFRSIERRIVQMVLNPDQSMFYWSEEATRLDTSALNSYQVNCTRALLLNMESKPPVRFRLFKKGKIPCYLCVSIHHALYDAASFNMIMNDVYDRYRGQSRADRTSFDVLLEFVAAQEVPRQKDFWTNYVSNHSPSLVPELVQRSEPLRAVKLLKLEISKLRALASKMITTLPILTQSVFGVILARELHRIDVMFGIILSGRALPIDGTENIAAPCITTIPCRIQFGSSQTSLASIISNVQSKMVQCLEFQHTSLRNIQHWTGFAQLFNCLFQYLGDLNEPTRFTSLWTEEESSMPADYPLAFELEPDLKADKLFARMVCTTALADAKHVQSFLELFDMTLVALYQNNDMQLSELGIAKSDLLQDNKKAELYDEQQWSDTEMRIRDIAARFSNVDESLITKNITFFQLGLDSVSALEFSRLLRQAHLEVRSSEIMKYPSIGALCKYMTCRSTESSSHSREKVSDTYNIKELMMSLDASKTSGLQLDAAYPCTPLQAAMITTTLASDGNMYMHHHVLRLQKRVSLSKLREACRTVVAANDVLRTSFYFMSELDRPWVAAVHRSADVKFNENACEIPIQQFVQILSAEMRFEGAESLEAPPITFTFVKTPSGSFLVISLHHCLYDGLSMPMILADIHQAYEAGSVEQRRPFYEAAVLIAERRTTSVEFWIKSLEGYQSSTIPQVGTNSETHFIQRDTKLDMRDTINRSRSLNVTLQSIALLAYSKLLACHLGKRDIVFGHVVAGRSLPMEGCESIVGPLFNTVPLRIRFDNLLRTNVEAAQAIQRFTADAQEHQHASLQDIQKHWRSKAATTHSSLFNTLFLFQRLEDTAFQGADLWEPHDVEDGIIRSEYPFNFEIEQTPHKIMLRGSSHEHFFPRENLATALDQFEAIMEDILINPNRQVAVFPAELSTLPLEDSGDHRQNTRRRDQARYQYLCSRS